VAENVTLEVLDWGGGGDPLIFVPGLSMNAHAFDDFAPRFTDHHRVIAVTRRGHGHSSWPDSGYSTERRVEDLRVVMDSLGLERAILAGHSMGGEEIAGFATAFPDRTIGLVFIDAAHDPTLLNSLRIGELCPLGPEVTAALERQFQNPEAIRRTQRRDGGPFMSSAAAAQILESEATPDYSGITAPALAVYHTPMRVEDVVGGVEISDECRGTAKRCGGAGLSHEASPHVWILGHLRVDEFDRDLGPQGQMFGSPNTAHAALAKQGGEAIAVRDDQIRSGNEGCHV
jgi:pimeloyl-ACP methyl ester carboxylesterase